MNRLLLGGMLLLFVTSPARSDEKENGSIKRPVIAFIDMARVHAVAPLAEGKTAEEFEALIHKAINKFALRYRIDVVLSLDSSEDAESNNRDVLLYGGISNFKGFDITSSIIDMAMRLRRPG